jgi:regulator of vacuolar morphogenesis
MASTVEISIPNTSTSDTSKPYVLYNISLRLPLRSFTVQKRYSEFITLHSHLTSQAGAPPPANLPPKSWLRSSSNPEFVEERRKGLEAYLRTINGGDNDRWRNTSAWRSFLNLPSNTSSKSSLASTLHSAIVGSGSGTPITDPVVWLDHYRDLKSQLHDARLALTRRDQASTPQAQHECSAQAKKCLVRAGTMIIALEQGLKNLGQNAWGSEKMGEGELRRRKDLVSSAKREKEGLEDLLSAMVAKAQLDKAVASVQDKHALMGSAAPKQAGRVLGRETDRTRALDNQGVLQLQKQLMQEQDEDVTVLAQAVQRQKELSISIQEELARGDDMLRMIDEDVTRVQGKMDVAKKRIAKIS